MRVLPAWTVSLAVLAIVPGWSFYYDVTPKAAIVLLGATLASIPLIQTPLASRWNMILGGAFAASAALSATLSPYDPLSWFGSNWRRSGAVAIIAALVIAVAATDRRWLNRAVCAAGLVTGLYAIAQYFGWDPWLPAAGYHFGEGEFQIVRPPGTMGHANYLAAFLLWPVFCGIALWRDGEADRWLGAPAAAAAATAIALCGSRGAWAGLLAGGVVWAVATRPHGKRVMIVLVAIVTAAGLFYISPFGERLRARLFWIGEDAAGGARLLLWRDSLRLVADRPLVGFGPEAFVAAFPQHQSVELSRAYPEFLHESPHNMFLDVLTGQGIIGLAILLIWIALALRCGWSKDAEWTAVLIAAIIAHQFAVFILPTALLFFATLALLLHAPVTHRSPLRWAIAPAGITFAVLAYRLVSADVMLAQVKAQLDAGHAAAAADLWGAGSSDAGVSADLYFSRRWAQVAMQAPDTLSKLRFGQLAGNTAASATRSPEQRQNAFYNLAQMEAAANDNAAVEASLRGAIAASPHWYKPHWSLARLLWLMGRQEEARSEAQIALDLNGGHHAEVRETLAPILRSAHPLP